MKKAIDIGNPVVVSIFMIFQKFYECASCYLEEEPRKTCSYSSPQPVANHRERWRRLVLDFLFSLVLDFSVGICLYSNLKSSQKLKKLHFQ